MDVRLIITADENALEFSRNLSGIFVNLVSGGSVKTLAPSAEVREIGEKLEAMEDETGALPWELANPKDTALGQEPEPVKVVKTDNPEPAKTYSLEELRNAVKAKGLSKAKLKELLDTLGIRKLSDLPEERRAEAMEIINA